MDVDEEILFGWHSGRKRQKGEVNGSSGKKIAIEETNDGLNTRKFQYLHPNDVQAPHDGYWNLAKGIYKSCESLKLIGKCNSNENGLCESVKGAFQMAINGRRSTSASRLGLIKRAQSMVLPLGKWCDETNNNLHSEDDRQSEGFALSKLWQSMSMVCEDKEDDPGSDISEDSIDAVDGEPDPYNGGYSDFVGANEGKPNLNYGGHSDCVDADEGEPNPNYGGHSDCVDADEGELDLYYSEYSDCVQTYCSEPSFGQSSFPNFNLQNRNNAINRTEKCDLQLPIPKDFRAYQWLEAAAQRFVLGTSGCAYQGETDAKQIHGYGQFILGSNEYIEGEWENNQLIVLHRCQLIYDPGNTAVMVNKQQGKYLLVVKDDQYYLAKVALDSLTELNFESSIADLKAMFFSKLTILEVEVDVLNNNKKVLLKHFETKLKDEVSKIGDPIAHAMILFHLSKYSKEKNDILSAIKRDTTISAGLRDAATKLVHFEENQSVLETIRCADLIKMKQLSLSKFIPKIYALGLKQHRQALMSKCSSDIPKLKSILKELPDEKILYLTKEDLGVFEHLYSQPCFVRYKPIFEMMIENFTQLLDKLNESTSPREVIPLMFPVCGFLTKSFYDIVTEIVNIVDGCQYEDMLTYKWGVLCLEENIPWPRDQCQETSPSKQQGLSTNYKSLEAQYKFIFQLMKHYSPDNYATNKNYDWNCTLRHEIYWCQKVLKMEDLMRKLEDIHIERLVWLYLLFHTLYEVYNNDVNNSYILHTYKPLINGHVSFIKGSATESHECFRVLTHNILRYIISRTNAKETSKTLDLDAELSMLQMSAITRASREIEKDPATSSTFRDLVEEFNRYTSIMLNMPTDTSGHFSGQISEMSQKCRRIMVNPLAIPVPTTTLVGYVRSLNDFLHDYEKLDFLSSWFVKSAEANMDYLEKVDNKLSSGRNCSYRVIDIDGYVKHLQDQEGGSHPIPEHHLIQIISKLLDCIEMCLSQKNDAEGKSPEVIKLEKTGMLLDAIRQSFIYLKEQPDYIDFDTFKMESVDPFIRLVTDSSTISEFKKRSDTVKDSFWYVRKMDEIGIDQALNLLKNINTCEISYELHDFYGVYCIMYNRYISKYCSLLSGGKSHSEGLEAVREMVGVPLQVHYTEWDEQFKKNYIPSLLGRLSAVWSILVSKDVSSTGKFLKPHCIQILCLMRLLSVDTPNRIDNHLAQVLTGQGKSVILALLSAILALTGHQVRVLCYSEYLSTRDQNDFEEFFKIFEITDKINYGTFDDMANTFLKPKCNDVETSLRALVRDKVLNHTDWEVLGSVRTDSKDTVLLIDEVDVFFSEKFYGTEFCSVATVGIEGLPAVQEHIWTLAKNMRTNRPRVIVNGTKIYIEEQIKSGNETIKKFAEFVNKPGSYELLCYSAIGRLQRKSYTNQSLWDDNLWRMASDAYTAANYSDDDYRLNSDDNICKRDRYGIYSGNRYCGYRNTFYYFRLKKSEFDDKKFDNYGYFIINTGNISYARLPSHFGLILGVSGTLSNLGRYEKSAIEAYDIRKIFILPSFFGESNLKFDPEENFLCVYRERDWLGVLYDKANQIVESNRAVIIFFESDNLMDLFQEEYGNKFDRLNEVTENTTDSLRDNNINEAGISRTVTLASRAMGRGVDFKSSLAVENNGGVHVIQTFYSEDIKEEIQIKGRTARHDNKGSYELVVCKEHLVRQRIVSAYNWCTPTYSSLARTRASMTDQKGRSVSEKLLSSECGHRITMKYYGLY